MNDPHSLVQKCGAPPKKVDFFIVSERNKIIDMYNIVWPCLNPNSV